MEYDWTIYSTAELLEKRAQIAKEIKFWTNKAAAANVLLVGDSLRELAPLNCALLDIDQVLWSRVAWWEKNHAS